MDSGAMGSPRSSALTLYVTTAPEGLVASRACPAGSLRFGGAALTVHDRSAAVASVFPAASVARTRKT
jgi:hypothetical protein